MWKSRRCCGCQGKAHGQGRKGQNALLRGTATVNVTDPRRDARLPQLLAAAFSHGTASANPSPPISERPRASSRAVSPAGPARWAPLVPISWPLTVVVARHGRRFSVGRSTHSTPLASVGSVSMNQTSRHSKRAQRKCTSTTAVRAPGPPVHGVRPAGTCSDTVYDAPGRTGRSSTVSQTSSTDVWRSQREGGPDGRPSAPLEHGDRPCVRASAFPGSHELGDGRRGGWCNLRPSPLSEGGEAGKEAGRRMWKLRTAMVAAIAI